MHTYGLCWGCAVRKASLLTWVLALLWWARAAVGQVGPQAQAAWPAPPATNLATTLETNQAPALEPEVQAPLQFQNPALQPLTNFSGMTIPDFVPVQSVAPGANMGAALAGTSQLAGPPLAVGPAAGAQALFVLGPVQLRPGLDYLVSYGDGLMPTPGHQVNTLVNQVTPSLLAEIGSHWVLSYAPTLRFYSSSQFRSTTDETVSLAGRTTYENWIFGLAQGYSSTTQPLVETGSQVSQENYSTALLASYEMNSKMWLDLSANQNFRFVNQPASVGELSNFREWTTLEWLNYRLLPRLTAGIGAGAGYDNVSVGPDGVFEDFEGRVQWTLATKLSLLLMGGVDTREFLNSDAGVLANPIFSLGLQYQLWEPTVITISGSRTVVPSYFQGAVSEVTSITAGVGQRLLGQIFLTAAVGYSETSFGATTTAGTSAPESNYSATTINVALSTTLLRRGRASVFYNRNYSSSGTAAYSYDTTEYGLELGCRF